MEYNELMQGFAAKFGVAGLDIHDGTTALSMDDMTVGFINDVAADAIMVVAEIGIPPPDANGPFGSMMLRANYLFSGTGGAVICQNPETGAYAVMRSYRLAALDVDTFAAEVETLLNTAEHWREIISGAGVAEEEKKSKDEELAEEKHSFGGLGGFMQV
jgi:hypothetical protein